MPGTDPILELSDVEKSFGGIRAVSGVSFSVERGGVYGLIGPNGAGKTTLFNLITGVYEPDRGKVFFDGREVNGRPVHKLVALGVARTFQNVELFSGMTVLENVLVGLTVRTKCGFLGAVAHWPWVVREEEESRKTALELLSFVGLSRLSHSLASELPFGWQRLAEIARALASKPKLLLLDEPAAGLNTTETRELGALIMKIRDMGVTVLLVEHDMSLTMEVCERIVVLDQGRKLAEGTPRQVQADERVVAAYLGA
ncbi:MAG: ABC transporter ATP-binding protein [Thermodesulfobacteriota bacterium]